MRMLNLGLRYKNLLWLGRAGSLHRPPVVLTPRMIGHFEDSVYEISKNLDIFSSRLKICIMKLGHQMLPQAPQNIMDERVVSVLKNC